MDSFLVILFMMALGHSQSSVISEVKSVRTARQSQQENTRIVCYYANWAYRRKGNYEFKVDHIDPHLCTHVLYAYAGLQEGEGVVPFDPEYDIESKGFENIVKLKEKNPNLKVMLSVGGPQEGSARFSKMAADPLLRILTALSARAFLMQFGFDGLDIAWQYPAFYEGSSPLDKDNFVLLLKKFKDEFKDELGLSLSVPYLEKLVTVGFDLPKLIEYLDFVNIMTFNYHESTEPTVNHIAPLYPFKEDSIFRTQNIDSTVRMYQKIGVDLRKFTMGIALYGVSYQLEDPENTDINSLTSDEGEGSEIKGKLNYNVICNMVQENDVNEPWIIKHVNRSALGPYAYKGKTWVAYDDEEMVRTKAHYAAEMELGGLMFWTIDMDDFMGSCSSVKFPLVNAGKEAFKTKRSNVIPRSTPTQERTTSPSIRTPSTTFKYERSPKVEHDSDPREQLLTTPIATQATTISWTPPTTVVLIPRTTSRSPTRSQSVTTRSQSVTTSTQSIPTKSSPFLGLLGKSNHENGTVYYSGRDIIFQNIDVKINNFRSRQPKR